MIEMRNISIDFPGVAALKNVNFHVEKGKIHALIGANGAGKSTLMKVLSGAYDHYRGGIYFHGKEAAIRSPKEAKQLGIQMVYQEVDTALIPYLTVGENIMLEKMIHSMGKKQLVNWKSLHRQAADILASLHVAISTHKRVDELTLAEKQMVLIARAISDQCKCLILDEPTAPLSQTETEELFRLIRLLKEKEVAVIFISHRLPELFAICEEITVMRNGELVMKEETSCTSPNDVITQMLGKTLDEQYPPHQASIGDTILEVKGLSDAGIVKNLNIQVKKGEIVGIAGLVGAGKTEICQALFGASSQTAGEMIVHGKKVNIASPSDAVRHGIVLVPEERRKGGMVVSESVTTNLTVSNMKRFSKFFSLIDFKKEKREAENMVQRLGIVTPSTEAKVANLSGGNQQKVVIGKWLMGEADIYIFDEPTKGVDVGAKREIFGLITELAKQGKGVIYASSELADILGMTNRVYVVYDGEVVKEMETGSANEAEILYYSTGGR
ncbi:ABC transporter [Bacillus sp. FJAT-27231]|uniref:sugar ABC transporter ATP-binding protein n=1 Tax=Bacillus sp. FJAT-27231 TaxID=1679168 RepID=UPI0006710C02|nr:sugar ABC transporter ATP-binding protein [Bacillus sp. FJAT-27231]KMY56009.1 ABC transporter [Bacillus sp. FJAT-27231]